MSDEMIYRDGVGYIPYHAHVRLMVVKDEQLATLRAEVLEEAARVADALEDALSDEWRKGLKCDSHLEGRSDGAGEVAAAIRALKG
jgi:hypothetical protein